jgi:hypothetical protein
MRGQHVYEAEEVRTHSDDKLGEILVLQLGVIEEFL